MDLEKSVQYLMDVYEVQQCASTYCIMISYMRNNLADCFTSHTPGQKVQITNWGIWEGDGAATRFFPALGDMITSYGFNQLCRHELTTPHIVIAKDRETAIGSWFSPGWECWPSGNVTTAAMWNWGAYRMVFRREDGKWKIWRLKYFIGLDCDVSVGWVKNNISPHTQVEWDKVPAENQPDKQAEDYVYSPKGDPIGYLMPVVDEYDTWDESMCLIGKMDPADPSIRGIIE